MISLTEVSLGITDQKQLGIYKEFSKVVPGLPKAHCLLCAVYPCRALKKVLKLLCIYFVLLVPSWYCTPKLCIDYLE